MEYVLFDLQFFPQSAGRYNVSVTCPLVPGDAVGEFVSPANDATYAERYARLQALDTDEDLLIALGRQLYGALFQDKVRDAYTTARNNLKPDQGLRLRFNIDPRQQPEVAGLPWEFLCDDEEQPLVLFNTPIVRYLPRFSAPPILSTPRPLKLLLSAAITEPKFDVTRELEQVRATLAELEKEGDILVDEEPHLTIDTLADRLSQGFHLWHFIGHGKLNSDGSSGLLVFEDPDGESADFGARDLRVMLNDSKLQVIILDACNSAQLTTQPYRSIAPSLMLANIGAVIAMQFKSPQENTRPFARDFYRALAAGEPLDTCVMRGRKAVARTSRLRNPDWGIPTVYTRAPDARLFAPAEATAPAAVPSTQTQPPADQGGVNISIGNRNTLNNSPIGVNAGSGREQAEDAGYEEKATEMSTLLAGMRAKRSALQLKNAKGQLTIGEQLDLDDTEKAFDAQRRNLLALRQERLAQLERRAAQPGRATNAALAEQLAEMRATVVEETLAVRQRELDQLQASYRIQPSDTGRARVQTQINALQTEIADLKRKRDG